MKNKVFTLITVLSLFLLGGCTKKQEEVKETIIPTAVPTVKIENLTWKDDAGFIFLYPNNVTVKQGESPSRYTDLTVGEVKIYAEDTKYKKIDDWAKGLKGETIKDVLVGGKNGKEVGFNGGRLVTGVIDENILFVIETERSDKNDGLVDQVIGSFEFYYPTATVKAQNVEDDSAVTEEEEVVE